MLIVYLLPTILLLIVSKPWQSCPPNSTGDNLLLSNDPSLSNEIFFSVSHYFKHQKKPRAVQPFVIQLLLLLSGTVEVNPGPIRRTPKFPCGECKRAVANSVKSIACDNCQKWYHLKCIPMGDQVFDCYAKDEDLEWICSYCALKDISSTLFDTSISSDESFDCTTNISKKKSKQLRITICNFQSLWNKSNILKKYLTANNIDILLGSETHLSNNIMNSEILPPNYTAVRKDRNDGYGCLLYTSPSPRDLSTSRMPSSA